jgi:hypothetical protein
VVDTPSVQYLVRCVAFPQLLCRSSFVAQRIEAFSPFSSPLVSVWLQGC